MANVPFIKKLAAKSKMAEYDVNDVVAQLNELDPGWRADLKVEAVPYRGDTITSVRREDFRNQHNLDYVDLSKTVFIRWVYGPEAIGRSDRPSEEEVNNVVKELLKTVLKDAIVDKNPADPKVGQLYIGSVSKPKIEERPDAFGRNMAMLGVEVKLGGVRKGAQVYVVTAPNGKSVTLDRDNSPALWTFLYSETDIADKAAAFLSSGEGEEAVKERERKQALARLGGRKHAGTCAVCRNVQILRDGKLVMHGYERPGYGFIIGKCFGVKYPPWEVSPLGLEDYVKMLAGYIKETEALIAKGGPDVTTAIGYVRDPVEPKWKKYMVTADGFEHMDVGPIDSRDVKSSEKLFVERLDADEAKRVLAKKKQELLNEAKVRLTQARQVMEESKKRLANWKPEPMPGSSDVSGSMNDIAALIKEASRLLARQ